jgi:hypothetical protein
MSNLYYVTLNGITLQPTEVNRTIKRVTVTKEMSDGSFRAWTFGSGYNIWTLIWKTLPEGGHPMSLQTYAQLVTLAQVGGSVVFTEPNSTGHYVVITKYDDKSHAQNVNQPNLAWNYDITLELTGN